MHNTILQVKRRTQTFFKMAPINEKQLMCLLTTIFSNQVEVLQVLNSCSTALVLLLNEYFDSLKNLEDAVLARNAALRRYLRRRERYTIRHPRTYWINPGRSDEHFDNILNDRTVPSEWHSNFRMNKDVFFKLVDLLRPYLKPNPKTFRRDSLSVEKKVAMGLYYLKDQGGYRMTTNWFGVGLATLTVILRQFCDAVISIAPQILRLPKKKEETQAIMDAFETKFGFPQVVGCIDGTHIPIKSPIEHGHEYFCYKMKHSLNVQAICDEKGVFLDVDISWPGSVHDGKVFKNSFINSQFSNKTFPGNSKLLVQGHAMVPPLLIGDPAYPLLPNVMKEYSTCSSNDEVVYNVMLRSTRNQIECAFGRLKARWRMLLRSVDVDISLTPKLIYTCFILHNFCEINKVPIGDPKFLQTVMNNEKIDQNCDHHATEDPTYTYNTGDGEKVRNTIKTFFSLH